MSTTSEFSQFVTPAAQKTQELLRTVARIDVFCPNTGIAKRVSLAKVAFNLWRETIQPDCTYK